MANIVCKEFFLQIELKKNVTETVVYLGYKNFLYGHQVLTANILCKEFCFVF